jgi:hypothetical protein
VEVRCFVRPGRHSGVTLFAWLALPDQTLTDLAGFRVRFFLSSYCFLLHKLSMLDLASSKEFVGLCIGCCSIYCFERRKSKKKLTDIGLSSFSAMFWILATFLVCQDFWIRLIFNSYQSTSDTKMQKI